MYLKLALRNIRRCIKDYAIYFVTLLFGVAVFYAFNSIGGQQVLFDLQSNASSRMFDSTQKFLNMFSGVIVVVLAFLILYANQFLIRRRKKEFGTYLILGMNSLHVSRMVLYETMIVGCVSLFIGLGVGVLLSQALSFFTALLFQVTMTQYQFIFSLDGCITTLTCFAIIYILVALLNTTAINRYKLIDLLHADEKNERTSIRNPIACFIVFLISLGILACSYVLLNENGLVMLDDPKFFGATICMLVGSLLFFWSLSGFVITVLTRAKRIYLKGIRPFTLRQIASRVNSAFASLWVVCVLLFFSITVFSAGMGMIDIFVTNTIEANPYSATLDAAVWYGPDGTIASSSDDITQRRQEMEEGAPERLAQADSYEWDMAACLRDGNPELWDQTVATSAQIDFYDIPNLTYGMLIDQVQQKLPNQELNLDSLGSVRDFRVSVISLDQFNATRALQNQDEIQLNPGSCALINNLELSEQLAQSLLQGEVSFEVAGKTVTLEGPLYTTQLEDNMMKASTLIFVLDNETINALKAEVLIPDTQRLNIMYANNGLSDEENDQMLADIIASVQPIDLGGFEKGAAGANEQWASLLWPVTRLLTSNEMIVQANGMRLMITYLALYIGLIFLVSTAAILAIQQLSQISDASKRYQTLYKLGCDSRTINHSILVQILIYFLLPLGLALCHSACAIYVLTNSMFSAFGVSPLAPILMTLGLVLVVYGGYLLITYLTARSIVKSNLNAK